jgi:hypothetical protein
MFTIKNNQIDIKYELVGGAANVAAAGAVNPSVTRRDGTDRDFWENLKIAARDNTVEAKIPNPPNQAGTVLNAAGAPLIAEVQVNSRALLARFRHNVTAAQNAIPYGPVFEFLLEGLRNGFIPTGHVTSLSTLVADKSTLDGQGVTGANDPEGTGFDTDAGGGAATAPGIAAWIVRLNALITAANGASAGIVAAANRYAAVSADHVKVNDQEKRMWMKIFKQLMIDLPLTRNLRYDNAAKATFAQQQTWASTQYQSIRLGVDDISILFTNAQKEVDWSRGTDGKLQITKNDVVENLDAYWARNHLEASARTDGAGGAGVTLGCFNNTHHALSEYFTSQNAENCVEAIKDRALWNQTQTDVNKMSPSIVFGILKFLGFKMLVVDNVNQIQTFADWWKNLEGDSRAALTATIRLAAAIAAVPAAGGNPPVAAVPAVVKADLLANALVNTAFNNANFIKLLINYINARPAILNAKNAAGQAQAVNKYGIKRVLDSHNSPTKFDDMRVVFDQVISIASHGLNGILSRRGVPSLPLYGMFGNGLTGGAISIGLAPSNRTPLGRLPEFTKQVESLFNGFKQRLNAQHKTLSAPTEKSVQAVFDSCREYEKKAKDILNIFDRVVQVNNATGSKNSETYTSADLKKIADNYSKIIEKFRRRYYSLLDITGVANLAASEAESKSLDGIVVE